MMENLGEMTPIRILVVEDENITAMIISAMLQSLGHHVLWAANGTKALEMIEEYDFDCILMDIQMPEMDGLETTRAIRSSAATRQKHSVPIIALTAHARQGDKERFLAAGMDAYLTKPVEMDRLKELLRRFAG
jgi:CheY-like chemotaxis protein